MERSSRAAINQRPEGAINRAEHFNRSAASLTGTEGAYSTLYTLNSKPYTLNVERGTKRTDAGVSLCVGFHSTFSDSRLHEASSLINIDELVLLVEGELYAIAELDIYLAVVALNLGGLPLRIL